MTPLSSWDSQKALAFSATTPRTAAARASFSALGICPGNEAAGVPGRLE